MLKRIFLSLCIYPGLLIAAESPVPEPVAPDSASTQAVSTSEWTGEGALGYASASGNSDSESLNAKLGITKEKDKWKHSASIESLKTTTDNVTSADRLVFKEKTEYKIGEFSYLFGRLRYENDEFSGFEYQASISFGAGSRFIHTENHVLDASAGIGYRESKDTPTRQVEGEGILTANAKYDFKISKSASFSEEISIEAGDSNTYSESETALTTKINGNLASRINYQVKHNSDVPVGTEKTDKVLTVSLVYSF